MDYFLLVSFNKVWLGGFIQPNDRKETTKKYSYTRDRDGKRADDWGRRDRQLSRGQTN